MRSAILAVTAIFFGVSLSFCAEPGAKAGSDKVRKEGYRLPASILVSDAVLSRIAFDEKQLAKIETAQQQARSEIEVIAKSVVAGKTKRWSYYNKRKKIMAGLKKQVIGLMTSEQKTKSQAGEKLVAKVRKQIQVCRKEYLKSRKEVDDDVSIKELQVAYHKKTGPLKKDLDAQLDELIGKRRTGKISKVTK